MLLFGMNLRLLLLCNLVALRLLENFDVSVGIQSTRLETNSDGVVSALMLRINFF